MLLHREAQFHRERRIVKDSKGTIKPNDRICDILRLEQDSDMCGYEKGIRLIQKRCRDSKQLRLRRMTNQVSFLCVNLELDEAGFNRRRRDLGILIIHTNKI